LRTSSASSYWSSSLSFTSARASHGSPRIWPGRSGRKRWLLDNRRPEVSIDQALRTLRIALSGDRKAMALLDQIAAEK
jgi:hypothetical protein